MAKRSPDKTDKKRAFWVDRTSLALSLNQADVKDLLRTVRQQSIRINTLAGPAKDTVEDLRQQGLLGEQYAWFTMGYTIPDGAAEQLRDNALVATGKVFIQNAASWLPVLALDPQPGDHVLDVCAAPGGKTSHIAAHANGQTSIVANDNSRPRLAKLRATMDRMHASVERYTLFDATQLFRKLDGEQFDKILFDAPCSGEGMMQLDRNKDFATWSPAQIKRLQQLQKRILSQAWQLLKPGGTLVYSTCTMAPEENEAVIDYLLRSHDDVQLTPYDIGLPNRVKPISSWNNKSFNAAIENCVRLMPSPIVEAFFICKLEKQATVTV